MAGRKSKSIISGGSAYYPIDLYTISYSIPLPRGQKTRIRELDANPKNIKQSDGTLYTKEQSEEIIRTLIQTEYENVQANQMTVSLPSQCPSCERKGTPSITLDRRAELHESKHRFNYNHSSGAPKTCYCGTVKFDNGELVFKLKDGLPLNSLGYFKRVGTYPLPDDFKLKD